MILYIALGLCAAGAAGLVYRRDLYEQEPLPLIALAGFMGAGAMWCAGWIEAWTFDASAITSPYAIAAVAAVEEELLRVFVVIAVIVIARSEFNDPLDGIIYGSIAGLGMAVEESIHYMRDLPPDAFFLPSTELVRVSGHLVMGGIGAFGLGPAMLRWKHWPLILTASFSAAVALHFGWDWIVLSAPDSVPGTREALLGAALMAVGLSLYGALTVLASDYSRRLFACTSPSRLWGWPFARPSAVRGPTRPGSAIPDHHAK